MDPEQVHRKIIHLDMDAFYASVDQRDFPEYRGKAIAVGGSRMGGESLQRPVTKRESLASNLP